MRFEKGQAYMASPTVPNGKRAVVVCDGRFGGIVTFSLVKNVYNVPVKSFDDREVAIIKGSDGIDYSTSSSVPVDIANAACVIEAIR